MQKRVTSSQKKTIICLIQALLAVVRKENRAEEKWALQQREIAALKVISDPKCDRETCPSAQNRNRAQNFNSKVLNSGGVESLTSVMYFSCFTIPIISRIDK